MACAVSGGADSLALLVLAVRAQCEVSAIEIAAVPIFVGRFAEGPRALAG